MTAKDFDCVRMKWEIQQRIQEQMEGLSLEQQKRWTEERILANPTLAPLWEKARRVRGAGLVGQDA